MALSIFTESEAPRDFRVSSTESEGHYKKCLLCYTGKKNFYCPDCIKAGNFVHSSMPYSDRFAEKQAKLLRLKANRWHVLDRCEKLLAPKIKKDTLLTEAKQSRDKIDLLRLAIEQRRNNIEEKNKKLAELMVHNNELKLKMPRYEKRVASLGKHAQNQRIELANKISTYHDQAHSLAALRRSRIRQLTKYIFPIYMTYDSSDSIEDMEFIGDDIEEEAPRKAQLHIVAPWINADADFTHVQDWDGREPAGGVVAGGVGVGVAEGAGVPPLPRAAAALALCAQLVALLAYILDARLPHTLALNEYCVWRESWGGVCRRARRVCAGAAALCVRSQLPPAPAPHPAPHPAPCPPAPRAPRPRPLFALHALCTAAAADSPPLGRVEGWMDSSVADAWASWATEAAAGGVSGGGELDADVDDEPPEHLHWPDQHDMEAVCGGDGGTPPAPAPASLVTSAAASLVSMWRGWTK